MHLKFIFIDVPNIQIIAQQQLACFLKKTWQAKKQFYILVLIELLLTNRPKHKQSWKPATK